MADTQTDEREQQLLALKSAMADVTTAASGIDLSLVLLLADIIHVPVPMQDIELASCVLFSQTTVERKIDIARKIVTLRLSGWARYKPHEYPHKVAAFILEAFNQVAKASTKNIWIRNTAAHGNILAGKPGDTPTLIPSPMDFDGVQRHHKKRGVPTAGLAAFPERGFEAKELSDLAKQISAAHAKFMSLRDPIRHVMTGQAGPTLEAALLAIGKDLQLKPPLQVRPQRQSRKPAPPKSPGQSA